MWERGKRRGNGIKTMDTVEIESANWESLKRQSMRAGNFVSQGTDEYGERGERRN